MLTKTPDPEIVLESLVNATAQLAESMLGWTDAVKSINHSFADATVESTISMVTDQGEQSIGIQTDWQGCRQLVHSFLDRPVEEPLSDEDVEGAFGEFMNIVAGLIKSELTTRHEDIRIGLPTVCRRPVRTTPWQKCVELSSGTARASCKLFVDSRSEGQHADLP